MMYNRFMARDIIAELDRGVLSAPDLRERLGVSASTLMRMVREARTDILRIGFRKIGPQLAFLSAFPSSTRMPRTGPTAEPDALA